jgi:hypothetical protein
MLFADLSQSFSILSDLKCYTSAFSSFTNSLSNAKPKEQPEKSSKKNMFFLNCKTHFFSFFFILPLPASKMHNFLIFWFNLSDLTAWKLPS